MAYASHPRAYTCLLGYMVIFVMAVDSATASIPATCGRELGMKSGAITNGQITASSTFSSGRGPWSAFYARIGNEHAWYASRNNRNQWLQVDLRKQMVITGVQTQGHYSSDIYGSYYVKTFKLQFKTETTSDWQDAFDGKEFEGNNGANRIKHNNFTSPVVASAIRFLPQSWNIGIALRVEILGCDLSDITCGEPPTIPDTLITENRSGDSYGAWRKYECAAGFTLPLPVYDLICGINGTWYWTNGAPDCTRIPTTRSTQLPISTEPLVTSTTESTAGLAAGVGGGLVLLVVIIIIVIVCRRKRRGRSDTVKLEDLQRPPTVAGAEERSEEVSMVRNDLYEWEDDTGSTGSRQGEHPEEVGFVRNDVYESVNRTGDESSNVTLLPAQEGTAALYTAVNKNRRGADDTGMVENIIYETRN